MATQRKTSIKKAVSNTDTSTTEIPNTVEETSALNEVKAELTPTTLVTVKNGFQGTLVYVSKKTHERFVWDGFGAEQDLELQELKNAKNSSKGFFENNWFLIDDIDVIDYLGVGRLYKNALGFEDFETLFSKSPEEVTAIVSKLSDGQKRSVAYKAQQLITSKSKVLDSIAVIEALEKALNVQLPRK